MIASFSMYDFPEVTRQTDAWWKAIRVALIDNGFSDVPLALERDRGIAEQWRDPQLLLTQTCGYPLRFEYRGFLQAVSIPTYSAPGCAAGHYSSAIIVRDDSPAHVFSDLRAVRLAANGADSQSGYNCVRDMVLKEAGDTPFFREVIWTGKHRVSIEAVRTGVADVAAIDAVSFELVQKYAPHEVDGIRVLTWGPQAPALPYATTIATDVDTVRRLHESVCAAADSVNGRDALDGLLIDGFTPATDRDYDPIVQMHERAVASGISHLAPEQRFL